MDEDIRGALTDIKTSVRDGFQEVNRRIDTLVTKGEHDATVQRLDQQHGTLRRDFETHKEATVTQHQTIGEGDTQTRRELREELEKSRAEIGVELEKIRGAAWRILSLAVPAAAVVAAIVFGILNLVI